MNKLILVASLTAFVATPALAQQPMGQPYHPHAVVIGTQIVGQDPDPLVRYDLSRNAHCYLGSCGGGAE